MEERYRLVFRGEVLDGHHPAVVKKKLGESLKVAGDRLDSLFAGKAVVIRRDADIAEATRYEAAFKKAGARLRLLPVESATVESATDVSDPPARAGQSDLELAPLAEGLLRPAERRSTPEPRIELDHLSIAAAGAELSTPAAAVEPVAHAPDWVVAPIGERLSNTEPAVNADVHTPNWSVAPPGGPLTSAKPPPAPAVDPTTVDFALAPLGTRLQDVKLPSPPPPDTSHLSLEE